MPVGNVRLAETLDRLAELLEIEGANPFRVRAYRRAARTVTDLAQDVETLLAEGQDLSELPGIGKDIAGKIKEFVETGRIGLLEEVEARTPPELAAFAALPGLGPKRVRLLYDELGIRTLSGLREAAESGKLARIKGFGEKTARKIAAAAAKFKGPAKRMLLAQAEQIAEPLVAYLRAGPGIEEVVIAGSYRRRRETVGDLDILATSRRGREVIERFCAYGDVAEIVSKGTTRSTAILKSGLQVDLRAVPKTSYGAALHYFTGSKAHNVAIRSMGVRKGLKINEYGVYEGERRIAGRTEREVYRAVGLPYIEPEIREDRGEIEAAREGRLPRLVSLADIRGDLHIHTTATDGRNTIGEIAEAARALGYDYVAISDHSRHVTIAHGLSPEKMARHLDAIDRTNERVGGIEILKSAEVDILGDGSLDLPDEILARLDLTVAAIHYKFDLGRDAQTERVLRAMDNPYVHIFAHPTGRLLNERAPYDVDIERVIEAALERGCFLEVNAYPTRLDLDDRNARLAKEIGVKVAISTDAHSTVGLGNMRHGVDQARRGWLEADDVLNTRSWPALARLLKRA